MADAVAGLGRTAPRLLDSSAWIRHPLVAAAALVGAITVVGSAASSNRRRPEVDVPAPSESTERPHCARHSPAVAMVLAPVRVLSAVCTGVWQSASRAVLGVAISALFRDMRADAGAPAETSSTPSADAVR